MPVLHEVRMPFLQVFKRNPLPNLALVAPLRRVGVVGVQLQRDIEGPPPHRGHPGLPWVADSA